PEFVSLVREKADLEQKLRLSHEEKNRLQGDVAELTAKVAALRGSENRALGKVDQVQSAAIHDRDAAVAAQSQLLKLKDDETAKDAELVAAQYRLRDLERKLSEQIAAVDRYRQLTTLASSSELKGVIAARNLHIIDVADVDNGGVRKPFGRVFYT